MKKLFVLIVFGIIVASSLAMPSMTYAHHLGYPSYNEQFHPRDEHYYDGSQRLALKERADIERASASNVHADPYSNDYYECNWQYNKNLGTWVCEKDYLNKSQPQKVMVCPYGYSFNSSRTSCLKNQPQYAAIPAAQNPVQVVATKYIYYYGDEEEPTPTDLPSTGAGVGCVLLLGSLGAYRYLRRKKL